MNLEQELAHYFGFKTFHPGQKAIIEHALKGDAVLGVLPTGSGKSLCYQLPGLVMHRLTVIVSPLISLMQDQVIQLRQQGQSKVVALNSTVRKAEQTYILQHVKDFDFLFVSPETLGRSDVLLALKQISIGLFVIDEAHCISQWGVDFRPSYLQLRHYRQILKPYSTLMLTATATPKVQADILDKLGLIKQAVRIITNVDRPNIFLDTVKVADDEQRQQLLQTIIKHITWPGIIYFSSRQAAEEVALQLQQTLHIPTAFYHGALSNRDRQLIQQRFMTNQIPIICATNAFGMGINKKNIRFVIHYHAPSSFESYLQEFGRAGRDGKQSIAITFITPADAGLQANLLASGLPSTSMIQMFYNEPRLFAHTDDQALELLRDFYSSGLEMTQVQQMLTAKYQEKQAALTEFQRYLSAATCKRQLLSDYFGQKAVHSHDDTCCCLGQDEAVLTTLKKLNLYQRDSTQQPRSLQKAIETPKVVHWQQTLKQLFE
ncbi:ATP-dependent DNA helicase RecQ [Lactobacillus sp. CC-MHH1034]|uniref:RecQ family ATP-dependent DNA helicase n=1 Tax=Agrilactobacillus fermenti TaxID=2586909 RepID=UPI001E3FF49D|nr:ATP-dependent DNA helicase RecQ [Agrilactobacillus fermenti]MCD2255215.1 ATP-dependent DNA helicase RecQ [Agrilactobacillus fermenti]